MDELEQRLDKIETHLTEIKADLKYHIKRTDELEKLTLPLYKAYIFFHYLIKALIPLSIAIGIYINLKK